jgi:hypothetical protein
MSNQHTYSVPFSAEQLRADYDSGMTQTEIASKYGASQKVVYGAMRRFGIQARKAAKRNQSGPANSNWRGDEATYAALHKRVDIARGKPSVCDDCGTTDGRFEWASVSGQYVDVNDYVRLCVSCHKKRDIAARKQTGGKLSAHIPRKRKEVIPC